MASEEKTRTTESCATYNFDCYMLLFYTEISVPNYNFQRDVHLTIDVDIIPPSTQDKRWCESLTFTGTCTGTCHSSFSRTWLVLKSTRNSDFNTIGVFNESMNY